MTLVAAYERQIGARGKEIKPGDPAPTMPDKKPIVLNLPATTDSATKIENSAREIKKTKPRASKKKRPTSHKRHKHSQDQ
jgi:hypothetical protein